jgi:hypothetical protein
MKFPQAINLICAFVNIGLVALNIKIGSPLWVVVFCCAAAGWCALAFIHGVMK